MGSFCNVVIKSYILLYVTIKYKGKKESSIKNINLNIQEGQCIVLCGRSGCGKTSNTRLLNSLISYFYPGDLSGVVEIDGKLISNLPIYKISEKVGSVFQNPNTQFFNTDSEIAFGIENLLVSAITHYAEVSKIERYENYIHEKCCKKDK
nr:ATP-binding cassette domain-containing protein [Clostridium tetanomorphum]